MSRTQIAVLLKRRWSLPPPWTSKTGMKPLLSLLAVAPLSAGVCACGGANGNAGSASQAASRTVATAATAATAPAPVLSKADRDMDNDIGAPSDDTNNNSTLHFGHAANASDRRAIASLIRRYYATALAQDGAEACSLLYSTVAEGAPEDYGLSPPGPPYMRGTTCPAVMNGLFKHFHAQLAADVSKLQVASVRLVERHGIAVLAFGSMPERRISVKREGRTWRVETLYDSELP